VSKLISWNIGWRVKARGEQLEWIAKEQADVVALQEVARASELQQKLFELGFEHFECTKPTAGRKKLVAIASREPFTVISAFAVPHPERAISCRMSLKGEQVELHCVSVPPGETYGHIKVEFLEAVATGISTRELHTPATRVSAKPPKADMCSAMSALGQSKPAFSGDGLNPSTLLSHRRIPRIISTVTQQRRSKLKSVHL
jgi:endonuclease/exonuclease/phosphatase family protein